MTAVPAAAATLQGGGVVRGKTGCFSYSYSERGTHSVTVYYHNRCKHTKPIKIRVARTKDACLWVKGGDYGKRKFNGPNPYIQSIKSKFC
ncbi:hypothetical protein [Sphaerisporangium rufum]|nr:hypothetical protein [Sphaerisporangium rufum]